MGIGIINSGWGIGDKVVYTSIAENYFHNTGERLIDVARSWEYDHNPFVTREGTPEKIIDLWHLPLSGADYASLAQRISDAMSLKETILRHARLYAFEDCKIDRDAVAVHVTGNTAPPMPRHVIDHIAEAYKGYKIIQLGGKKDQGTPFIDQRGLPIWETVRVIASCGTFIGIDSGLMNIANCYPRVRRKVVLTYEHNRRLPVTEAMRWIDYGWEYYNPSPHDVGISLSYRKLIP